MRQFSSLDFKHIVKELQFLVNGKIDQIYHPEKKELILQFHVPSKGRHMLRILPGKILYLTKKKEEQGTPSSFCMFLRKYLANSRLKAIEQVGFERIVNFKFETKDANLNLYTEFFDKGNIILVDDKNKIINCLEQQKWKLREIKKGEQYKYPKKEINFANIKLSGLKDALKKSDKELVRTLANVLGLGGVYSEELCLLAKLDKKKSADKFKESEIKNLFDAVKKLRNKKIKSTIVYSGKDIKDIVCFSLEFYKDYESKCVEMISDAFDTLFVRDFVSPAEKQRQKKMEKQEVIIKKQGQQVKRMGQEIKDNQRKAELLYENYQLVQDIIDQIKKASKKYSWQEIKEKLKNHKVIKEVNSKDKKVVLEI